MLRFMAHCMLFAFVLGGVGLVWPALLALALFFAAPVAWAAWHLLGPGHALRDH